MKPSIEALLFILSSFLVLGFKFSATSEVHFFNISAAPSIENAVCPEDTLIYSCNIALAKAKGITLWLIYMANSSKPENVLQLEQIGLLGCAYQTVTKDFYAAMNVYSSTPTCVNSNFTVKATANLNGKSLFCVNLGGAYSNIEGSTNFSVAGTPDVTIIQDVNELLIRINSVPPEATNLVYSINVFQGNVSVSDEIITNGFNYSINNLTSNTEYTVIVSLENCPNIRSVNIKKCTLAFAQTIDVAYDQTGVPKILTWADMGGCVQEYQVQLTTSNGSTYHYIVSRMNCSQNCSIQVDLPRPFKFYMLSISSIVDGTLGPVKTTFINGTNSTILEMAYPLNTATPLCPNVSYKYACSNTDLVPGYTVWRLPSGTCPCQSDSIILARSAVDNCSNISGTCGNFMAVNNEPINGFCLTSILTLVVESDYNNTTIQCCAEYDNGTQLKGEATILVASPPEFDGVIIQRSLSGLQVALNVVEEKTVYAIEIANVSKKQNGSIAAFNNLLPNMKYDINIFASNCAEEKTFSATACTVPNPPTDVRSDYLREENKIYVIYWTSVGGCVTKYRVKITTDDGNIIVDDDNVMSSSYLMRRNDTTLHHIQVYSITEDAVESVSVTVIDGPPSDSWLTIGIVIAFLFLIGVSVLICAVRYMHIKRQKKESSVVTNSQPTINSQSINGESNSQRTEETTGAINSQSANEVTNSQRTAETIKSQNDVHYRLQEPLLTDHVDFIPTVPISS